jgi:hypothetical protein
MGHDLRLRVSAIERTMVEWRQREFVMPRNDCGKLLLHNCKKLKVAVPQVSKLVGYKTPLAASSLLKKVYGVRNLFELCDKFWERIPVASALPSDPIAMPGFDDTKGLGSIALYIGNDAVFGYVEGHDTPQAARMVYEPDMPQPVTAWRLPV